MKQYILDSGGEPVLELDLNKWAAWIETANRQVAEDWIGTVRVSTVFLGLDHRFDGDGPPILWETMIFGGPLNGYQVRCSGSREQAQAMHQKTMEHAKKALAVA